MKCSRPCKFESEPQHSESPGVVEDDVTICRGGYYPMHYKPGKKFKNSIIKNSDLTSGKVLSFWRIDGEFTNSTRSAIEGKIWAIVPEGNALKHVFCPKAGEIRDIELPDEGRIFCVVDECRTDLSGNFDPDHCGVRLCQVHLDSGSGERIFFQVRNLLLSLLKKSARDALRINQNSEFTATNLH